jgi:hypothetical protein
VDFEYAYELLKEEFDEFRRSHENCAGGAVVSITSEMPVDSDPLDASRLVRRANPTYQVVIERDGMRYSFVTDQMEISKYAY